MHLNVVVRDGRAHILHNLEPSDFSVVENGAGGTIRSVQPADPKQKHLVALLFDPLSGEPGRLAREGAIELLNASAKVKASFGVFVADASMWAPQPFTQDLKAVRKAVDLATSNKPSTAAVVSPDPITQNVLRTSSSIARESHARPAIAALLALIRGTAAQPGRKVIVYFSQGLPVDPRQDGFRVIVSSANRAGIAVYTVDTAALAISRDEEIRRAVAMQTMARVSGEQRSGLEGPGNGPQTSVANQTAVVADRLDLRNPANAPTSALSVLARSTSGFLLQNGTSFRSGMRRVAEELTGYYEITYLPHNREPDGTFRTTQVAVNRQKTAVQGREGYFATPDISGRPVLPYEIPLLGALQRPEPAHEVAHRAAVLRFRGDDGNRTTVAIEIPAQDLKFQQDDAAGVLRARVAVLALVRDKDGAVIDRISGDNPILCPPGMLADMRRRVLFLQKEMELPAGNYVLETAVHDRFGEQFGTSKTPFIVPPAVAGLGLSSVAVVRAVTPGAGEERDAGFHLEDKTVQPALDGVVNPGGAATVYFKVYPSAGAAGPVDVGIELWSGEKRAVHSAKKLPEGAKASAELLALDLKRVPPGTYELRVTATQGTSRAEERTSLIVPPGAAENEASLPDDNEIPLAAVETPKAVPPTVEQLKLLETVRDNALKYSGRLPNFICTQATRRMIDPNGKGEWRTIEEASDLLSFYDGQEHYAPLTARTKARDGEWPASVSSAGEFGSMLKEVFEPASMARFAWLRREQVRGRTLQVFSYTVQAAHSRYRITYRGAQQKDPVFAAFHGQVAVDPETGTVLRLSLQTEPLPADLPVRQVSLAIDYDEVAVADQIYLLPIAATIDVRLHKRTVARNEVTFRSYQRFSSDSRITFQQPR
jgi:VWFA-related protein